MYSKRYRLEKIEEFGRHNPIYDGVEGHVTYPAYFNVGERGWFLWIENGLLWEYAHRIHTSIVKSVEYTDDAIIVETHNTRLTFILISE